MPMYEYRCRDCHETFEQPQKMAEREASTPACPACGGQNVEQVFSGFFAKTSRKS